MTQRGKLRDYIRNKTTGQIGLIVYNDQCGGVFRGHAEVWFGALEGGVPVQEQISLNDWEPIEVPMSFQRSKA